MRFAVRMAVLWLVAFGVTFDVSRASAQGPASCEVPPPPTAPLGPNVLNGVVDALLNVAEQYLATTKESAIALIVKAIESSDPFQKQLGARIDLELKKRKLSPRSFGATAVRAIAKGKAHHLVEERIRLLFEDPAAAMGRIRAGTLFAEDPE